MKQLSSLAKVQRLLHWRRAAADRRGRLRLLAAIGCATLPNEPIARQLHWPSVREVTHPATQDILVGEFLVGEKGDRRIIGHPAIRY